MNRFLFERASTKMVAVSLVGVSGVVAGAEDWLGLAEKVPPQWWVVIWMAGITFFLLRWMSKLGKKAPRAPDADVARLRAELQALEKKVYEACEALAHLKGRTER